MGGRIINYYRIYTHLKMIQYIYIIIYILSKGGKVLKLRNLISKYIRNSGYPEVEEVVGNRTFWDNMSPDKGIISKTDYDNMTEEKRMSYTNAIMQFAHKNINLSPTKYVHGSKEKYSPEYSICYYAEKYNVSLRRGIENKEAYACSDAIKHYKLINDIVVYRGIDHEVMEQTKREAHTFEGVDIYDKAFLHTSLTKATTPRRKYNLRILLPKGTCAFYAGNVNGGIESFQEVVVQRGAKLKILSEDEEYTNCLLICTD